MLPSCLPRPSAGAPASGGRQTSVCKSRDKSHKLEGDPGILKTGAFQVFLHKVFSSKKNINKGVKTPTSAPAERAPESPGSTSLHQPQAPNPKPQQRLRKRSLPAADAVLPLSLSDLGLKVRTVRGFHKGADRGVKAGNRSQPVSCGPVTSSLSQ